MPSFNRGTIQKKNRLTTMPSRKPLSRLVEVRATPCNEEATANASRKKIEAVALIPMYTAASTKS